MKFPWFPLVFMLLSLVSCTPREAQDAAGQSASSSPVREVPPEPTDPRFSSYARKLGEASLALVSRTVPDQPAALSASLAPAYYGRRKYSVEGQSLLVREAFTVDQPAADAPWEPDDDLLYPSESQSRWQAPYTIVAGPVVFEDAVLVATSEPALTVLDRRDLSLRYTRPMRYLALGPMLVDEVGNSVLLQHADGSSGVYALAPPSVVPPAPLADPVAALIGPESGPLKAMAEKTGSLLSAESGFAFSAIDPYGPAGRIPPSGAELVRFEASGTDALYQAYIDEAGERPYLLALFDPTGVLIASNVEYQAAKVLEFTARTEHVYYIAAAFMGGAGPAGRLVIVPRQR